MNSQSPLVSVLMSCYNSEEYIDEAILSILNQTYQKFEFIIINDGSEDKTLEKIKAYNDERISIINHHNMGIVPSLNDGLKSCKGKYIARMDADDISSLDRIEKLMSFLEQNPDISACGGTIEEFNENGSIKTTKRPLSHIDLVFYSLHRAPISNPSSMIRATVFTENGLKYDPIYKYGQDVKLWSEIIKIGKLANLPDQLLQYRRSDNQVSTSKRQEQKQLAQTVRADTYQYIRNHPELLAIASTIHLKDYFKYMVRHDSSMLSNKKIKEICTSKLSFIDKTKLSLYSLVK